jgi:hypothetical protein
MLRNIARILRSTREEVKNMKSLKVLPICLAMMLIVAGSAFAVSDTVSVSASVTQGTASIAIKDAQTGGADLTAMSFAAMTVAATNHRARQNAPAGGAWVEYFSGGGTFEIRAWYDNFPTATSDPTKAVAGLKTTVSSVDYFWPHKIWCSNFGGTPPVDPNVDTNWTGTNAIFKWVYEKAYKVDGFGNTGLPAGYPAGIYKNETRTTLTWFYPTGTSIRDITKLDGRVPSRFRVDLGIDSQDAQYVAAAATSYSGTLVFDLTQAP